MARTKKSNPAQASFLQPSLNTAPCVPAIREAVGKWVASGYKGATATTRTLLSYWFHNDHRPGGVPFRYHYFQKEAIETLVYLYEVAGVRRHKPLLENYAPRGLAADLRLLQYDDYARYCLKMATGSGKTKVMALAVAWQYFNAVLGRNVSLKRLSGEEEGDVPPERLYAATSLIIAPNVIVFERLKDDFAGGRIYRTDPIIPKELEIYWDVDFYMRGDGERAHSQGAVYLTNIHQLYDRPETGSDDEEPDIMTQMLGRKPPAQIAAVEPFAPRLLARGGPLFIVNDEAHHTHDEGSEWLKTIRRLHNGLVETSRVDVSETRGDVSETFQRNVSTGVIQLDLSATPRYSKGSLFTWTVFDYPLKQAILDNVVKRPYKGIVRDMPEQRSDIASIRYAAYLTAGVERWREYREQLAPLKKKPVLFVMMNSTKDADDVAAYLRDKYPTEFAGPRLHIIHTNNVGEVARREEDDARQVAADIDKPDSPVNCIVSVLMLREGWDVQAVTVVVGLRPYTAKANILPEQTIGRGLRLMFRGEAGPEPAFRERVDVIGNKAFIEFVEELEKEEEVAFGTFEVGQDKLVIETILPDPDKATMDIVMPELSPSLERKKSLAEEIAAIDVSRIKVARLPRKQSEWAAQDFHYEGYDIITLEKQIERQYTIPEVQTSQEVISYYAKRIAADVKLPSQFAALVPKIREFLTHYAFGETVDLDDPAMIKAIRHDIVQHVTVKAFVALLREVLIEERTPLLVSAGRPLSSCPGFAWARPMLEASKTIFNLVAADNEFEKSFARFLEKAPDVTRFAKLSRYFGFAIPYTDAAVNLRYYEPDFVAVTVDGVHHLIETKGQENVDVSHKDRSARLWCENATMLTGTEWHYLKVPQKEFESLRPVEFDDLIALEPVELL
jgi:type III restriction enzyme